MNLRYLSVCSGLEGASLAFAPLGWTAVGYSEIEAFPAALIAERFGSNLPGEPLSGNAPPNFGDFTQIDLGRLGPVDLLVGGTPCQAFSIAGKRLSLGDARGNLTLAYVVLAHELARSHGLRNAFWENVPGVLTTPDNAFGCFLGSLVGGDDPVEPVGKPARGKSNAFWRWRKAGVEADDDGNDVIVEEGHITRWPRAGMVAGPVCRAAWRILDAQYFGVAQRRERVFVVADFGNGADPAAVLFEPQGVRGNSTPSRETRERPAPTLSARTQGGGGLGTDFDLDGGLVAAFGGGNRSGPVEQAATLTARRQKCDFEVETFIAHSLRAEGFDASEDGTGRGTPIVPVYAIQERAVSENPNAGPQGAGVQRDIGYTLEARHHVQAVAFDTTQITSPSNFSNPKPGDPVHPLAAGAHVPAIAFTSKDYGGDAESELSPTLRAMGHGDSHANGGGQLAVAFDLRGREGGAQFEGPHDTANIRAASGGSSRSYVAQQWVVRRLTPTECERLQGIPDGHTRIAWRGKPADECPDGPRYKALGNSWAVPVVRWIGARIDSALEGR